MAQERTEGRLLTDGDMPAAMTKRHEELESAMLAVRYALASENFTRTEAAYAGARLALTLLLEAYEEASGTLMESEEQLKLAQEGLAKWIAVFPEPTTGVQMLRRIATQAIVLVTKLAGTMFEEFMLVSGPPSGHA